MPKRPSVVTVYAVVPSPTRPHEYVPGISPEGTEVPASEAKRLIDAGLVTSEAQPAAEQAATSEDI